MSAAEKVSILANVASSTLPKRQVLRDMGVPKSTYYRWLRRPRLDARPGGSQAPWNRLTLQEEQAVLAVAQRSPELSCRQLAAWITDNKGFSVSESTVYRILRREGLVKSPEMQLKAGKEYHRKTTGPHQMWATDASYFRVTGSAQSPGKYPPMLAITRQRQSASSMLWAWTRSSRRSRPATAGLCHPRPEVAYPAICLPGTGCDGSYRPGGVGNATLCGCKLWSRYSARSSRAGDSGSSCCGDWRR